MVKHFFPNESVFLLPDGGAGAGAAGGASAASGEGMGNAEANAAVNEDPRLAAAREREAKRNPLKNVAYGRQAQAAVPKAPTQQEPGQTDDEAWEQLKKGRFASQYGRDVQAAIQDRFKNQQDNAQLLKDLEPMHQALFQKYGVEDLDALKNKVLDDDSLYEDLAIEMGTTVAVAKQYAQMQKQLEAVEAEKQESMQQQQIRQHLTNLAMQGEEMKKTFPDFDIQRELANPVFRRLTAPEVGISVRDAYYAVHRQELEPRAMAYGIQKAQEQMSQRIQSQARRPMEGAMKQAAAVEVRTDPRSLTKADREEIKRRAERARKSGGPMPSF